MIDTDAERRLWTAVFLDLIAEIQSIRESMRVSMNGKCAGYKRQLDEFCLYAQSKDFELICEFIGQNHLSGIKLINNIVDGYKTVRIPYKFSDDRCKKLSNASTIKTQREGNV